MCERKTITDEELDEVFAEGLKLVIARKNLKVFLFQDMI